MRHIAQDFSPSKGEKLDMSADGKMQMCIMIKIELDQLIGRILKDQARATPRSKDVFIRLMEANARVKIFQSGSRIPRLDILQPDFLYHWTREQYPVWPFAQGDGLCRRPSVLPRITIIALRIIIT
jgi:hypothetical protein